MRINQYIAQASGLSRRVADEALASGQVLVNGRLAEPGYQVKAGDVVTMNYRVITPSPKITIMLNKPVGYVSSRNGQGSKTIYKLLPTKYHNLKSVGRLDKDSSGLLLMTNNGQLANELTHPSFQKEKIYQVKLDKPLTTADQTKLFEGVKLTDGLSTLRIKGHRNDWVITMTEGRNRQIRRTFEALKYKVVTLHRTTFGNYELGELQTGKHKEV